MSLVIPLRFGCLPLLGQWHLSGPAASQTEPLDDVEVPLAHSEQGEPVGQDVEFRNQYLLRVVCSAVVYPNSSLWNHLIPVHTHVCTIRTGSSSDDTSEVFPMHRWNKRVKNTKTTTEPTNMSSSHPTGTWSDSTKDPNAKSKGQFFWTMLNGGSDGMARCS